MNGWQPATDAEAAMREALQFQDQENYFRILADLELVLPVSQEPQFGNSPRGWATWAADGRTHVLAFTSPEALGVCLAEGNGVCRKVAFRDLANNWPDLEWWLAVNPGLPIEAYLPAWFVAQVSRGDVRLRRRPSATQSDSTEPAGGSPIRPVAAVSGPDDPVQVPDPAPAQQRVAISVGPQGSANGPGPSLVKRSDETAEAHARPVNDFTPANQMEKDLVAAANAGSTDKFLSTLLLAKVLVPGIGADQDPVKAADRWRRVDIDGSPYVEVFTSPQLLARHLEGDVEAAPIKFTRLIHAWPDPALSFSVNPGSPIRARMPGTEIVALASWATEVGLTDEPEPSPAPTPEFRQRIDPPPSVGPDLMQKTVPAAHLPFYLDRAYERVSGFVHRVSEVEHLRTPAELYAALGLGYSGSPFRPDDAEVYLLRWSAHCANMYRVPFGGRNTEAMHAMQGWMIERAPYRGNGFAPSEGNHVIAEFKVDSARLPHGAQLWHLDGNGNQKLVATLDVDGPRWQVVDE